MDNTGTTAVAGTCCGAAHDAARMLILESLRHWANLGVDGFRFDLASAMARDAHGQVQTEDAALISEITALAIARNLRVVAEAWDIGVNLLGKSYPGWLWAQWNGQYRDDVRAFVRGDAGKVGALMQRLYGSDDLFPDGPGDVYRPYQSVNFITAHDGFCLYDLVAYNHKHNAANGHNNTDGTDHNVSWNCGWDTKTTRNSAGRGKAPSSITVRMYNVGFGDCFLLTFHYPSGDRHMLIDYGSTAGPKNGPKDYMRQVAEDVKKQCGGKLHIVVATHRHRDHISGFSTDGEGTGKIIASLNPDHVIQPWTEDPNAKPSAMTATAPQFTGGKPDESQLTAHFLGSLEDMHAVAERVARLAAAGKVYAGRETVNQLSFLGEDNLKNLSAVQNLMSMGKKTKAYYVNAGMALNNLLPGVKITVLGPPTLKQSEKIRKERAKDPDQFWQFRSFWASQSLAAVRGEDQWTARTPFGDVKGVPNSETGRTSAGSSNSRPNSREPDVGTGPRSR